MANSDLLKNVEAGNFIDNLIIEDLSPGGRYEGRTVHTRFPPEPNGYLHIGHAKAIYIDFETAKKFNGLCNLRMDDTNPEKEEVEYVEAIKEDVKWLGYSWDDRFYYASDYFGLMFEYACQLIEKDLAYVCQLSAEEVRNSRGSLTEPATPSPYRNRNKEESLRLFHEMKDGLHPDGSMTLRARIDLASGNFNMRDPVFYRINRTAHHRTGTDWCIYPMYDFAHPMEDAIEEITHSLCSLEFEDHRPLYEWFVNNVDFEVRPRQIEFARLNITGTVMSKRRLRVLVESGAVESWDDPRMPTLSGLRRRGYTPESIRSFCERIGVSKVNSVVDYAFLEHCLREDLNMTAQRVMVAIDPLKLTITNYPEDQVEHFQVENNPENPEDGMREVSFSSSLWIEANDFMEVPAKGYRRLFPGNEVRLKSAYIIKCTGCRKDENGKVIEVFAEYDTLTKGGSTPDQRKIRGTIHWVDAANALDCEVRLYDSLFTVDSPDQQEKDFTEYLNPDSLVISENAKAEKGIFETGKENFQFFRLGYFHLDKTVENSGKPIFNRSVSLKDSYRPPTA